MLLGDDRSVGYAADTAEPRRYVSSETDSEADEAQAWHDEDRLSSLPPLTWVGPTPTIHEIAIPERHLDPDAVKVIRRLTRHGYEAFLVGGGVRDLLLGKRPKDFDVATSARPHEVRGLFRNCRIIGRRFRLAHILFAGGKIIEVATFRRDPTGATGPSESVEDTAEIRLVPAKKSTDDDADLLIRHDNVFGEPHEDAVRRDFTINGLFYDLERGQVIDFVGGVPDLQKRLVRTIGDPQVRLQEDPVRILRAIKFSARLDLGIEPDLYDGMVERRLDLQRSARPRILEELFRLLRGGAAHRSVHLAWDLGALHVMLPELAAFLDDGAPGVDIMWRRLSAIDELQQAGRLPTDAVLLAALLAEPLIEWMDDTPDPSVAFEEFFDPIGLRLAVPRRLKDKLRSIVVAQKRLRQGKLGVLPRREFFAEAAMLFATECEALEKPVPQWAKRPQAAVEEAPEPRARRRRRRRRDS